MWDSLLKSLSFYLLLNAINIISTEKKLFLNQYQSYWADRREPLTKLHYLYSDSPTNSKCPFWQFFSALVVKWVLRELHLFSPASDWEPASNWKPTSDCFYLQKLGRAINEEKIIKKKKVSPWGTKVTLQAPSITYQKSVIYMVHRQIQT